MQVSALAGTLGVDVVTANLVGLNMERLTDVTEELCIHTGKLQRGRLTEDASVLHGLQKDIISLIPEHEQRGVNVPRNLSASCLCLALRDVFATRVV